jgi:hypothetical protein
MELLSPSDYYSPQHFLLHGFFVFLSPNLRS